MVNSIFDSGYFYRIRIIDVNTGTVIEERSAAPNIQNVPAWFRKIVCLDPGYGDHPP